MSKNQPELTLINLSYIPLLVGVSIILATGWSYLPSWCAWIGLGFVLLAMAMVIGSLFVLRKNLRKAFTGTD